MAALEITWSRVFRLWWLLVWRTAAGILLVFVVGIGLIGFASVFVELPEDRVGFWFGTTVVVAWPLLMLPVMKMILKKRYRDFRIEIVAPPL